MYDNQFKHLVKKLDEVIRLLHLSLRLEATNMANLDELLSDVEDESTKLDSLSTFVAGLKQQVADALSGASLPPAVQAKVDAVFNAVEANKAKVAAAMDANVPPGPAPTI